MLPRITELELNINQTEAVPKLGKSFLFDFDKGDFVLKDGKPVIVAGIEALKMWIEKAIRTERYHFRIYEETDFGTTINDLIGSNYPRAFVESEIKREVTASLLNHPYIQNIQNWQFARENTCMKIEFQVVTANETFAQEVTL